MLYSARLGEVLQNGSGVANLFTVAGGVIYVVRSLTIVCTLGTAGQVDVYRDGGVFYHQQVGSLNTAYSLNGLRWVFNAAETLKVQVISGDWQLSAHGYILTA